jgi:hypothetical protein
MIIVKASFYLKFISSKHRTEEQENFVWIAGTTPEIQSRERPERCIIFFIVSYFTIVSVSRLYCAEW